MSFIVIDAQLLASASDRVLANAQMTFCAAIAPWLLLTTVLGACAHAGAGWRDGPTDREMKNVIVQPVHATSDQSIAWVDEERVLFEGWDRHLTDPIEKNKGVPVPMHGLYIWNVRSGAVVRYTKEPLRSRMCFSEGFISYSVRRSGRTVRLEGPFGKEKEVEMQGEERLNPFTCKWYDVTTLPKPIIGGGIEPLREEHGWIEHTGSASWFRSTEGKLTQLALAGKSIGTVRPQKFSHFVNKYIFWRGSINRTLLIDTAGSIELQPQPEPPLHGGQVEPAGRNAMLLRSTQINVRAEWDVGQAGLYKFSSAQSVQKVTEGLIQAMQVHRDGCLVAVIVDPWNGRGREHVVRAFDLCR